MTFTLTIQSVAAIAIALLGNFAQADTMADRSPTRFPTRIVGIDRNDPNAKRAETLVFLEDGRVAKLSSAHTKLLRQVEEAELAGTPILLTIDAHRFLTRLEEATAADFHGFYHTFAPQVQTTEKQTTEEFVPSVLPDMKTATGVFESFNSRWRARSECYNRAHVWVYETKKNRDLNLMKVFMFFTRKYIWEYDYNWWFHVSPFTYVQTPDGPQERVLDYRFLDKVVTIQQWTDWFVEPHPKCPVISKYQDYSEHQQESYCYLAKVPMYYWQPRDIENVSNGQPAKTDFIQDEVNHAYWQGFR